MTLEKTRNLQLVLHVSVSNLLQKMYKNLIQGEKKKKIKRERDDENKCDVECVGIILLNIQIEN